ncbi:MAG TPA: efflux RND transporter periplasmic adaptor subunit [Ensifer sp.]|nr:efflux RND transporter periplasmic adaptor subunit [Ensifer sp.]
METTIRNRTARVIAATLFLSPWITVGPAWSSDATEYKLQVFVQKAHKSDVSKPLNVTGIIAAAKSSDLSFRVGGTVIERLVQTGDTVKAGQVLARLGTAELEANITAANAGVASAKATLDLATSDLSRQKSLLDKGFATRSAYEQSAKSVDVAQAQLKVAQSQLQIADDNLSYAELKAGSDGVITAVNLEVGQVVQAGQAVVTIANGNAKQAVFDVSDALITSATIRKAEIFLVADPSVKAQVQLTEVSPTVNVKTGTVRVKADIIDPPARMTLGAAVAGSGDSQPLSGFPLPYSALSQANGAPIVWVIDPATSKAAPRKINLLQYVGQTMIVSGDLKEGDLVVTRGGIFLSPDLAVKYTEAAQ